jgi:oligopeptidase B
MKTMFNPSRILAIAALIALFSACNTNTQTTMDAPVADKIPHELTAHEQTRIDDYYWLNDRNNPDVVAYLEAENDYT